MFLGISSLCCFLALFANFGRSLGICPEHRDISPCTCRILEDESGVNFAILTCEDLDSEVDLVRILAASRPYDVFELELINSRFKFLPHDAFQGTQFQILSMHNSSVSALSDTGKAFEGLEKSLHLIEIINCSFVNDWDWHQMSHLDNLMEVHVSDSELLYVTEGIARIAHLEIGALAFQKNKITFLTDFVFSPFENIKRIALDGNEIKFLKRTMFPRPSKELKILGLSSNDLRSLPRDIFTEMPALKSLYLTGNPLHTIDEMTFRPIWKQLRLFLFYSTPLSCDCRITWLAKSDNSLKFIHAVCQSPVQFKGRELHSVRATELWC